MTRILVALVVLGTGMPAWPCSIALPRFEIDESAVGVDTQPPAKPVVTVVSIGRAQGGGMANGSCSDIAGATLSVSARDDRTMPAALGWGYRVVSGSFRETEQRWRAHEGQWTIHWSEQSQPPIGATLAVFAIDKAGNESEPTEVALQHPGDTGCSSAGAASVGMALGLLMLGRRVRASNRS